jgi:hypothetical protein
VPALGRPRSCGLGAEDAPGSKRLVAHTRDVGGRARDHGSSRTPEAEAARIHGAHRVRVPGEISADEQRKDRCQGATAPEQQRPELARQYIAPRTALEEKLAAIWSKVLRVDHIGVHDNFFELGGDSILSIQIISLARREGLHITPKLLFAHQTDAELAAVTSVATSTTRSDESDTGDLPLTPIQRWFFEQNLAEPHHYNQSFMFEVASVERAPLERALEALSGHHDALQAALRPRRVGMAPILFSDPSTSFSWSGLNSHTIRTRLEAGD